MKRLIVRIMIDKGVDPELYEVPGNQAVAQLVPNLVKVLNLPEKDAAGPLEYWLESSNGTAIRDADTLTSAGIRNNMVLKILSGASKPTEVSLKIAAERKSVLPGADRVEQEPGKRPVTGWRRLRVPDQGTGDIPPTATWKKIGT
ncbi:EsaB/YukD family protein [Petrachloros mirabilis]